MPRHRSSLQSPARTCDPQLLAQRAGFRVIAGVDEAGRGPWAGPVVSAAVVLHAARLPVRIDDSKKLSPLQRERAFAVILQSADVGVGIVSAEFIDRVNILQATLHTMQQAVAELRTPPDLVLVDGSITPPLSVPCWPVIGGDACSYVISCASIVAKVVRDRLMAFYHRLYPSYQFAAHKGYGTPVHTETLRQWGPSLLHRYTFAPVAAAEMLARPNELTRVLP